MREKNYGKVKGNRSGLKQEQGRDKIWQVLDKQGRELRRGSGEVKKKTQTAKRLVQIESNGRPEGHRAENTPARPTHVIILLIL